MAERSYIPEPMPQAVQGCQVKHFTRGLNVSIVNGCVEVGPGDITCWTGAFATYSYRNDQPQIIRVNSGEDATIVVRHDVVAATVRLRKIIDYENEPASPDKELDLVLAKIWLRPTDLQ